MFPSPFHEHAPLKGWKRKIVKLLPCLSYFFTPLLPPSLPFHLFLFQIGSLIIQGGIKSQLIAVFRWCYFWPSFLFKDVIVEKVWGQGGGGSGGLWGGFNLLASPSLVVTHNMSGTHSISMLPLQLPRGKSHARPWCFFKEVASNLVRATSHLPC